jgi:hypothetical protein
MQLFKKISQHQVSDIRHLLRNLWLNILESENLTCMNPIRGTILKEIHKIRNILNSYSFILVKPDKENRSHDSIDVNFHVRSIRDSLSQKKHGRALFSVLKRKFGRNCEIFQSGQIRTYNQIYLRQYLNGYSLYLDMHLP